MAGKDKRRLFKCVLHLDPFLCRLSKFVGQLTGSYEFAFNKRERKRDRNKPASQVVPANNY